MTRIFQRLRLRTYNFSPPINQFSITTLPRILNFQPVEKKHEPNCAVVTNNKSSPISSPHKIINLETQ